MGTFLARALGQRLMLLVVISVVSHAVILWPRASRARSTR